MHHKNIKFILAIAFFLLIGGCTPKRVTDGDTLLKNGHSNISSNNLRITLLKTPDENVRGTIGGIKNQDLTNVVAASHYKAAKKNFRRIGSVSENTTFSPHLVISIKKVNCENAFGAPCKAIVDLYWGTGEFIRTYAEGKQASWLNGLAKDDCFDKIFQSITEQMLADEILAPYFRKGFDDSLASATPNIPQLPHLQYKLRKEAKEAQRKALAELEVAKRIAQDEANLRESEDILAKSRTRGLAFEDEIESILSLGPVSSALNALILESLLPFPKEMDQALMRGNLQEAKSVSHLWRNWLERSQGHISQEAEESVNNQLAHLDILDHRLSDTVVGKLTIKLAQAIEEERWEDAKKHCIVDRNNISSSTTKTSNCRNGPDSTKPI